MQSVTPDLAVAVRPRAIVLLSGGLDSATCLAWACQRYTVEALSFRYGQRHHSELAAASEIARSMQVPQRVIDIDLGQLGGSALTDTSLAVPEADTDEPVNSDIPITYVPARNTVFLAYALAAAEVNEASAIVIGVNAVDYSGYPDCRPEFIRAFETLANLATRAGVSGQHLSIQTPLLTCSKAEIIRLGTALGVDYSLTVSCYQADLMGRACGRCDSCRLRAQGFKQAGLPDPTRYQ